MLMHKCQSITVFRENLTHAIKWVLDLSSALQKPITIVQVLCYHMELLPLHFKGQKILFLGILHGINAFFRQVSVYSKIHKPRKIHLWFHFLTISIIPPFQSVC